MTALATFEETTARAWTAYREATAGQPPYGPENPVAFDRYVDAIHSALRDLRAALNSSAAGPTL